MDSEVLKRKLDVPPPSAGEEEAKGRKLQKVAGETVAADFGGIGDMTPDRMLAKYPELVAIMDEEGSRIIPVDKIIAKHPVLWQRFKDDPPVWAWFKENLPQFTTEGVSMPAAQGAQTAPTPAGGASSSETTDVPTPEKAVGDEKKCSICFEGAPTVKLLDKHNCSTCTSDAWAVCELCDDSFRSRACPFCKNDYLEHLFFAVKGIPKMPINFAAITDKTERFMMGMKLNFLAKMVAEGGTPSQPPPPPSSSSSCRSHIYLTHITCPQ
jgi:hypothetical protein